MGRAESTASVGSKASGGRYRPVAPNSFVDETLFASPSKGAAAKTTAKRTGGGRSASPRGRASSPNRGVVTVNYGDLQRMMAGPATMTADQVARAKAEVEAKKADERASAAAKIARMTALAEEARKHVKPTETEALKAVADKSTLSRANFLLDEQRDAVKAMNQKVLYSKCVTVRDAQLLEKKHLMQEEEEWNRRADLVMEMERLKAIEATHERERLRDAERRRGGEVIKQQIHEREGERARKAELKEQEGIMLKRELARLKAEEDRQKERRAADSRALMAEVAISNEEQIKRKELMKIREKEEDDRIADYVRSKDAREAAAAAEKERAAKEKELETARLRAAQEKEADKAALADEIRARRYQEAKERDARARDRTESERKEAILADVKQAREQQKMAKLRLQADLAEREYSEFVRVLEVNKRKEIEEDAVEDAKKTIRYKFKEHVQGQIRAKEEAVRAARDAKFDEGRRLRAELERERVRLLEIKNRKLSELASAGVPAKYQTELAKAKIKL